MVHLPSADLVTCSTKGKGQKRFKIRVAPIQYRSWSIVRFTWVHVGILMHTGIFAKFLIFLDDLPVSMTIPSLLASLAPACT